tara:strand:+ start:1957 stop:2172 length:216 start_codon:yes stop_codon:yes gene_type:complete
MPLTRNQKKIDANKDGKITREDLKMLRKGKKKKTFVDKLKNKVKDRVLGKLTRVKDQERLQKLREQEGYKN